MGIHIRRAIREDLPWVIDQLKLFAQSYDTKLSLFSDDEYSREALKNIMKNHILFVATDDEKPIGFIAGVLAPHSFNPSIKVLSEIFWWVEEVMRGSRAGYMLLKEFISWGKSNADWINLSLHAGSPIQDEALLKRGFKLQERSFLMEVSE